MAGDQMKVKLFAKHRARARSRIRLRCKPGNKRGLLGSSLRRRFAHEEKITMSGEMTMAVVAVVTALAFPVLVSGNDNRGNAGTYQFAQYCVPQYDELSDMTRLHC